MMFDSSPDSDNYPREFTFEMNELDSSNGIADGGGGGGGGARPSKIILIVPTEWLEGALPTDKEFHYWVQGQLRKELRRRSASSSSDSIVSSNSSTASSTTRDRLKQLWQVSTGLLLEKVLAGGDTSLSIRRRRRVNQEEQERLVDAVDWRGDNGLELGEISDDDNLGSFV